MTAIDISKFSARHFLKSRLVTDRSSQDSIATTPDDREHPQLLFRNAGEQRHRLQNRRRNRGGHSRNQPPFVSGHGSRSLQHVKTPLLSIIALFPEYPEPSGNADAPCPTPHPRLGAGRL